MMPHGLYVLTHKSSIRLKISESKMSVNQATKLIILGYRSDPSRFGPLLVSPDIDRFVPVLG